MEALLPRPAQNLRTPTRNDRLAVQIARLRRFRMPGREYRLQAARQLRRPAGIRAARITALSDSRRLVYWRSRISSFGRVSVSHSDNPRLDSILDLVYRQTSTKDLVQGGCDLLPGDLGLQVEFPPSHHVLRMECLFVYQGVPWEDLLASSFPDCQTLFIHDNCFSRLQCPDQ